jgi:GT2 family glycosyltransferase
MNNQKIKRNNKLLTCIIILNWNGLNDTIACLNSLLMIKSEDYKIFVIDNGSKSNEALLLKRKFDKKIYLYRLEENTGFTGGCSMGVKLAKKYNPDFFLFLNNDVVVEQNFLSELISVAQSSRDIGIVGPFVYDYHKKNKLQYSAGEINWLIAKPYHKTDYVSKIVDTKFITGCSMLIKKKLIEELGSFDEKFFAYFEDVAYCLKAKEKGYRCVSVPSAAVYHKVSGSSNRRGSFYTYLISRNRIIFINNYTPNLYRIYFFVFNLVKLISVYFYFTITLQLSRRYAFLRGYLDGYRKVIGRPNI